MKKYFLFVFCLLFAVCFVSCGKESNFTKKPEVTKNSNDDSNPGTSANLSSEADANAVSSSSSMSTPISPTSATSFAFKTGDKIQLIKEDKEEFFFKVTDTTTNIITEVHVTLKPGLFSESTDVGTINSNKLTARYSTNTNKSITFTEIINNPKKDLILGVYERNNKKGMQFYKNSSSTFTTLNPL